MVADAGTAAGSAGEEDARADTFIIGAGAGMVWGCVTEAGLVGEP